MVDAAVKFWRNVRWVLLGFFLTWIAAFVLYIAAALYAVSGNENCGTYFRADGSRYEVCFDLEGNRYIKEH